MLTAADDALMSAADSELLGRTPKVDIDNKFRRAIDLLGDFTKDFPPTSDPNIGGTATGTGEVKMSDKSKYPSAILRLQALKNDVHSNVIFLSVSLSLC